jgi:hypothetical protein
MADMRQVGEMSKGVRGSKVKGARVDRKPALKEHGIDKHLAQAAREAAAMPGNKFEAAVTQRRNWA